MRFTRSIAICLMSMLCVASYAQVTPPIAAPTTLQNLYAGGASWNQSASPQIAANALWLHALGNNTYSVTIFDALPSNSKPFTVSTNIGAGVVQNLFTINTTPVFCLADSGFSWTGSNLGWNYSGGCGAAFKLRSASKGSWYVVPHARFIKQNATANAGIQPIVGVDIGWGDH